ncbi:MAG: stalk domain-containing protein, partial [Defluviitaleaceae bacterium]|nr:stalk domain-containing protein [Defluviitaleaceae bacterium]
VVFTEGSHLIRFNGQLRDADVSLAIPFLLNGVLWVPVEAASLALPGTVWTLDENDLTVTFGTASYEGIALVATQAVDGGDAAFVPLQIIANVLGVGNIGWDIRSNTLVVVTGIAVEQGNVLYNAINNRHEAWYGSPNSLVIATNFVYFQRDNGGWPRGNGQINAMPFQPDVGGMSPEAVQIIANNHAAEDSYFGRGITTNETRFLLRMYEATGIERFRDAGLRGLDTIFNVQNAGGGWPYQITGGSYHRGVSISDNAIENIMTLLMNIYKDDLFVDTIGQARVARNANAFNSGMNWILGSQVRSSGFADGQERLTGWPFHVYQHGINNLPLFPGAIAGAAGRPAWAREFEPPSISGNESIDIVGFLMTIPNPSQEVQDAIHAAVYFFDYIQITGYRLYHNPAGFMHPQLGRHLVPDPTATRSLWARFIDVETLSPLFYDRTVPTSSPHSGVSPTNFQAEHGAWLGTPANHISHNATSATNARGGTRRSLYRDANGVLSTDPSGTFDLAASFHNLSHERRMGFNYINHFAENLPEMYEEWIERIGLDEGPQLPQPTPTPTPDPGTPTPDPGTPTPDPGTPTPDPGTPTPDPGIPTPQPPQILPVPQPPSTTTQPSVVRSWRSDRTSTTRPGAGANRVVQQTQVPELVQDGMLIPISESSPIILDIIENAIQAASIPMVTFVLQDEVGVVFSYEGLQLIIEQNGYLEIMRDYFSITFDSEFLARLGEPGDEITIIVLPQEIIIMINGIVVSFEEGQDTTYQPIIPISEVTMATLRLTVGSTAYYLHGSVRQSEEAPFVDLTTGRTMVPLRIIAEALGMNVTWNEPARTVHIITEQGMLIIPVDVSLPDSMGTPIIVNGRTFVPVRYVMEALGANVEWNEATGAIYIYR